MNASAAAGKKGKVSATKALRKLQARARGEEIEEDDAGEMRLGIEVGRIAVPGKYDEALAAELDMLKRDLARHVSTLEQIAQVHEPVAKGRARRVLGWSVDAEAA